MLCGWEGNLMAAGMTCSMSCALTACKERKGKERKRIYIAPFYILCISQSARAWISMSCALTAVHLDQLWAERSVTTVESLFYIYNYRWCVGWWQLVQARSISVLLLRLAFPRSWSWPRRMRAARPRLRKLSTSWSGRWRVRVLDVVASRCVWIRRMMRVRRRPTSTPNGATSDGHVFSARSKLFWRYGVGKSFGSASEHMHRCGTSRWSKNYGVSGSARFTW